LRPAGTSPADSFLNYINLHTFFSMRHLRCRSQSRALFFRLSSHRSAPQFGMAPNLLKFFLASSFSIFFFFFFPSVIETAFADRSTRRCGLGALLRDSDLRSRWRFHLPFVYIPSGFSPRASGNAFEFVVVLQGRAPPAPARSASAIPRTGCLWEGRGITSATNTRRQSLLQLAALIIFPRPIQTPCANMKKGCAYQQREIRNNMVLRILEALLRSTTKHVQSQTTVSAPCMNGLFFYYLFFCVFCYI